MAGSPKKGSSKGPKSSKSKRSGKATVPKTGPIDLNIEESPKSTQNGKTAAVPGTDFNNEDYNIRSPERTKLLTEIKDIIKGSPVSPVFWAGCQLADMSCLHDLARTPWQSILVNQKSSAFVATKWAQRFRDSDIPGSEIRSGSKRRKLNPDEQSPVPRSTKAVENCKERDGYKCTLTKTPYPQAAHIFPYNMINPTPEAGKEKASTYIPEFWELLFLFWDMDRVMKWQRMIFSDPENPGVGVEGCFNLISLSPSAHDMWNRGEFVLKPLKLSRDQKKLTVQFFWQVPGNYERKSRIDLLTEPTSSKGLSLLPNGSVLPRVNDDGSTPRIHSGDTFTFTTKDPKNLPLPSLELLEMQWALQRLVGMAGTAGWPSFDSIDDDSIDGEGGWFVPDRIDYNVLNSSGRIREWVAEEAAGITPESSTSHGSLALGDAQSSWPRLWLQPAFIEALQRNLGLLFEH